LTPSRTRHPGIKSPARLTFGQAVALGALHGPTELLPISSSGHTTAVPWLLGSGYAELDPELRKALEVALHAGAVLGLLIGALPEPRRARRRLAPRDLLLIAVASAPAGASGLVLERRIESVLGTPATIAAGFLAGGLAMALTDRAPEDRRAEEAEFRDALWIGLAQAIALAPGISRGGATLAAARWRRFRREDARRLSEELAWPVIAGATVLKAWRVRQGGLRECRPSLLAGGAASFISTILTVRLSHRRSAGSLLPYALYRAGIAAAILLRLGLSRDAQAQGDTGAA
jgi:undecaprenyl-diphosphatase